MEFSADIRVDLYSLGCTLFCLLAGCPPFQEGSQVKAILTRLEKEPQPLPELRPNVKAKAGSLATTGEEMSFAQPAAKAKPEEPPQQAAVSAFTGKPRRSTAQGRLASVRHRPVSGREC